MTTARSRHRKTRERGDSRAALCAAAAEAFAARGFDGAGVDEIAAAAGVNKAMLYYHFKSKRGLYTAVLVDVFGAVAARVAHIPATGAPPQAQLEAFVDAIAHAAAERPHFPPIWLRELADEGRHLDPALLPVIRGILEVLTGILTRGRAAGTFRPVNPLLVHFGIIGPLLVILASPAPRKRLLGRATRALPAITPEAAVAHIKTATLASVMSSPTSGPTSRPTGARR